MKALMFNIIEFNRTAGSDDIESLERRRLLGATLFVWALLTVLYVIAFQ